MRSKYICFTRTWWRRGEDGTLIPHAGRKTTVAVVESEQEARRVCAEWNRSHPAGPLSRKCEYMAGSRL